MIAGFKGVLALAFALVSMPGFAATCRDRTFGDASMTVCRVDLGQDDLRLFWKSPDDAPYGGFRALDAATKAQGLTLQIAMNAGMFHEDLSPVGLYTEEGRDLVPLVTRDGPGNFGLLPNGVFCIQDDRFTVIESRAFAASPPDCRFATQSGPMLVINGALHPRFLPQSDSLNYRNGVGVSDDGKTAFLVISNDEVNFHLFARFFRDALGIRQALYLDGSVSRLFDAATGRSDLGWPIGPILAVVAPKDGG